MRQISSTILITILCFFQIFSFPALAEEEKTDEAFTLYAQSAVLIDGESGRVLYGKNDELQRPMASTTKIMTCILALENGKGDDIVTASANAAAQPKVHLGMRAKETFYLNDLLYALMLESFNDAAVAIAEQIGGSTEGFARMMNQKAKELGCNDTWFITPNGLDAKITTENGEEKIHSTTAGDLARIMKYCVTESPKKDEFLKITQTRNHYFSDVDGKRSFNCSNHNALLTMMDGVLSGKTGFTGGAGYSYVGAVENDGRIFIIALLGCGWPPHKTYKWSDARKLLNYGMDNYKYREVFEEVSLAPVTALEGISEDGDLSKDAVISLSMNLTEKEKSLKLLMKDSEQASIRYEIPKQVKAPVRTGDILGHVIYELDGEIVRDYPVFAENSAEKLSLSWCLFKIWDHFLSMEPCLSFS